ncbi:zinc phosphodiesterase elac protein 2-like protein, partial [Chrysochromulina tobinii]
TAAALDTGIEAAAAVAAAPAVAAPGLTPVEVMKMIINGEASTAVEAEAIAAAARKDNAEAEAATVLGREASDAAAKAEAAAAAAREMMAMAACAAATSSGAQLTFLGTGAAMPSKYRNVSSMLLQLPTPPHHHVLRRQVEYYFSEANLPTDRFLQEQLQSAPNGWLALSVIATFKRVQALVPLEGHVVPDTALALRVEALASALHGHPTLQIRQKMADEATAEDAMAAEETAAEEVIAEEAMVGVLLDAGEGAMGALRRRFGERTDAVLRQLRLVWISHMHADHHLGLISVLEARTSLVPREPLLVLGPLALQTWLRSAAAALHLPLAFRYVHNGEAHKDAGVGLVLRRLGFDGLRTCPVVHCNDAWAVGLQHADGWSILYSGDTRPCDNVVRLGNLMRPGGRLLVHEATFDDSPLMRQEAEHKRHSTVHEALAVGEAMHAWRTVLTHFSQRYPKLTDVRATATSSRTLQ